MTVTSLIFVYSIAILFASLIGGWLPSKMKLGHTRTQIMMSYVAGFMLGVAFYHLLPHAVSKLAGHGGVDHAVWWLMVGLLLMFVLLRLFHFHQHGPVESDHEHDHGHSHNLKTAHNHDEKTARTQLASNMSWLGVAFGLALHTLIDGIALGAAVQADSAEHAPLGLLGFGVFLAIVLHKPLDAISISSIMHASGWSLKSQTVVNLVFATMCPIGAYLFLFGADSLGDSQNMVIGSALAFSAGVFICISLSDLLPEIQFHSHDRGKLTLALVLGVITAYGIGLVEPESAHHESASAQKFIGDQRIEG